MRSLLISAALLMAIASTARGQATGAIRGTVLLPGGASAPSAVVSLRGTIAYRVTADSAGRFLLTAVLEGRYLLVAALGGNNPGTRSVKIRAGDTLEVTITLGGPVELQELTVRGLRPLSYAADSGSTGARMPVPIRDLPQTVTVVTREVVHDRNITTTRALAENVSGVTPYAGYDGYGLNEQGYIIRGMATSYTSTTLRDGFKDFAGVGPRDLANVERVEFLKGPSSVLYGATGALGGVPNTITRKPTRTRVAEVTLSDDRFGFGRGTLDLGGPVTRDSSVRYRLIAAGERSRNFRPFNAGSYGLSVSPSLELSLGARTELRISGEYTRRRYRSDPFFPHDSVSLSLPVDRYLGEPGLGLATARGFVAQAVLEHRFALGIRLRQGLSILGGRQNHQGAGIGSLIAPDTLERWASITRERSTDYASQTDLLLDGRRLGVRHRALVGVEVSRQVYSIFFTNDGLDPINIRNPTYGAHRVPGDTVNGRHPEDQLGIYVQDLVDLGSRVKLMVGARFDINRTRQFVQWPALGLSGVVATQTTRHVTPRVRGWCISPPAPCRSTGGGPAPSSPTSPIRQTRSTTRPSLANSSRWACGRRRPGAGSQRPSPCISLRSAMFSRRSPEIRSSGARSAANSEVEESRWMSRDLPPPGSIWSSPTRTPTLGRRRARTPPCRTAAWRARPGTPRVSGPPTGSEAARCGASRWVGASTSGATPPPPSPRRWYYRPGSGWICCWVKSGVAGASTSISTT